MKNDISNIKLSKIRSIARVMGYLVVFAFVGGIIVDVDHPLAFFMGETYGRFLHPYFAISGAIFIGIGIVLVIACLCRCLRIRFLGNRGS